MATNARNLHTPRILKLSVKRFRRLFRQHARAGCQGPSAALQRKNVALYHDVDGVCEAKRARMSLKKPEVCLFAHTRRIVR
jgi:hypothetical protein